MARPLINYFYNPLVISMLSWGWAGGGGSQGEPAPRNTVRTKRKRVLLCTTNALDLLQEHEILNFISVLAGTTLMTVTFS